ncbi:MAG: ERF family protein [Candidatus Pacebacteria bacterium]|nr:ERF family protein [Candidatus Paceibacterota bacterium]MCF7917328.1 ERF family protein [Candidatus Omnitrophota bacterium]
MKSLVKKLSKIQSEIKVGKNRENKFGGFSYRSADDIYQVVKPYLEEHELALTASDEVIMISSESSKTRYYMKSTIRITDGESEIIVYGMAREADDKKGMDVAQISGGASSYARKYALAGLFALDGGGDNDPDNPNPNKGNKTTKTKKKIETNTKKETPAKKASYTKSENTNTKTTSKTESKPSDEKKTATNTTKSDKKSASQKLAEISKQGEYMDVIQKLRDMTKDPSVLLDYKEWEKAFQGMFGEKDGVKKIQSLVDKINEEAHNQGISKKPDEIKRDVASLVIENYKKELNDFIK